MFEDVQDPAQRIDRIRQNFLIHTCKQRPIGPENKNDENNKKGRRKRKQRGGGREGT